MNSCQLALTFVICLGLCASTPAAAQGDSAQAADSTSAAKSSGTILGTKEQPLAAATPPTAHPDSRNKWSRSDRACGYLPGNEFSPKKALVIGNALYASDAAPLGPRNLFSPVRDANGIANALKKLGFRVLRCYNAAKDQMDKASETFIASLYAGDEALFYFSGHGGEAFGRNYLLPSDFTWNSGKIEVVPETPEELAESELGDNEELAILSPDVSPRDATSFVATKSAPVPDAIEHRSEEIKNIALPALEAIRNNGFSINEKLVGPLVSNAINTRQLKSVVMILDACRTDLVPQKGNANAGFIPITAPPNSYIAFAAAPSENASDGSKKGEYSVFTKHLLKQLRPENAKGRDVDILFREVRRAVWEQTRFAQRPWSNLSLIAPYCLYAEDRCG